MLCIGMGAWAEEVTFSYEDYKGQGTSSTGSEYTMDDKSYVSIGESKFNGNTSYAQFYAGGTITVTPKSGATITKIAITTTGTSYNGYQSSGEYTASTGKVAKNTSNNAIVEWKGSATSAFTIEHDKQIRWTSIVVTYTTSGSGSTPDPTNYTVTIVDDIANGTVTANPTSAAEGATVTLTATPATGYEFGSWNVTNAYTSAAITVTDNKFTMPAADVNVSATFNQIPSFEGTITTMSADNDADIKFVTGSSSATNAFWANSTPLTANNITLSGSVTSGTNYSYYDGSVVRFYANNNIVITPSNGATIVTVEIVRQTTTGSNSGTINCSGLTASKENTTTNTNVYTGSTTSAVTFTNTAQARFTKIIVYTTGGKTLQSVTVSGTPTKTTYEAGETFDPAGLTVTGNYDDESQETISEGITWSTPEALTAGQTSVSITATVNGITSASYTVTGLTVNAQKTLTSIAVSGTPSEFWKGDAFNHDGMTVTATYSDETTEDITSKSEYTGYDMSIVGEQEITVTYQGETCEYGIEVKTIANTQETAYTVAEAIAIIDAGKDLGTEVFVKGLVSEIVTEWNESFGNISFNISDNGKTEETQFQFFRNFKGADKTKWTSQDEKPIVGSSVLGYGKLTKYNSTYEFAEGNYLVEMTKPTEAIEPSLIFSNDSYTFFTDDDKLVNASSKNGSTGAITYALATGDANDFLIDENTGYIVCETPGTYTVTATIAEAEGFKGGNATCTVTVKNRPVLDFNAVVSAYTKDDVTTYYAMGSTVENKSLNAVQVSVVNDKVVNAVNADAISWALTEDGNVVNKLGKVVSFYKTDISLNDKSTTVFEEIADINGLYWLSDKRSFIYRESANGFKSYATSNAETEGYGTVGYLMPFVGGYTRTVTEGNYGTICLPNTVKAEDVKGADFYSVAGVRKSEGEITGIVLEQVKGELIAGTPYIFKATSAELVAAYTGDAVSDPISATGLVGNLSSSALAVPQYCYVLSSNTLRMVNTGSATVGQNRAYINLEGVNEYVPSAGVKAVFFGFDGTIDEETAIESINENAKESTIYNLQGQRVNKAQKGLYIVNGKKVIFK